MNDIFNALNKVPTPVAEAIIGLLGAAFRLAMAETDPEREEALMNAAEVAKKALDYKKFGSG